MSRPARQKFTIDLVGVRSSRALHARLAKCLPMPDGYGRNYDALFDVLTEYGPTWSLNFVNGRTVPKLFRKVCEDAVANTPGLVISFE